jgi:hypothetical protein
LGSRRFRRSVHSPSSFLKRKGRERHRYARTRNDRCTLKRLDDEQRANVPWKKWGPCLSERQWGAVGEDYSQSGDAWNYFRHDQGRSRAYRWGSTAEQVPTFGQDAAIAETESDWSAHARAATSIGQD